MIGWRATMPIPYLSYSSYKGSEVTCFADDVEPVITRANAELDAAEAREAAKDARISELEAKLAAVTVAFREALELCEWFDRRTDDPSPVKLIELRKLYQAMASGKEVRIL